MNINIQKSPVKLLLSGFFIVLTLLMALNGLINPNKGYSANLSFKAELRERIQNTKNKYSSKKREELNKRVLEYSKMNQVILADILNDIYIEKRALKIIDENTKRQEKLTLIEDAVQISILIQQHQSI